MIFTVGLIPTEDVEFLQVLKIVRKRVEEKKRLRTNKDRDSKPHKDNPYHTIVKDKDQQMGKDQPKYNMNRNKRNDRINMTIKKKANKQKMHERFSSTKDERFSTAKNAREGIDKKLIKMPKANGAKCW
jgi:hypothetical protein